LAVCSTLAVRAKPIVYDLPDETADFKPGPGIEIARAHCTACHSADYVTTQPRGPKFGRDFWQSVVTKMIKVHGAPIDEHEAEKIVDYLSKTYR
jgi:mono/diheme cytochrome c family protein